MITYNNKETFSIADTFRPIPYFCFSYYIAISQNKFLKKLNFFFYQGV